MQNSKGRIQSATWVFVKVDLEGQEEPYLVKEVVTPTQDFDILVRNKDCIARALRHLEGQKKILKTLKDDPITGLKYVEDVIYDKSIGL